MRNFKILLLIFILSSKPFLLSSQRTCGTDHFHNTNMEKPEYQKWFKGIERKIEDELQRNRPKGIRNTIHVPVAIHFNGGVTNANMCCLINASLAQIQVLNDDFASINADIQLYENIAQQCPNNFPLGSLSDGTNIQFFLATSNHPSGSGLHYHRNIAIVSSLII